MIFKFYIHIPSSSSSLSKPYPIYGGLSFFPICSNIFVSKEERNTKASTRAQCQHHEKLKSKHRITTKGPHTTPLYHFLVQLKNLQWHHPSHIGYDSTLRVTQNFFKHQMVPRNTITLPQNPTHNVKTQFPPQPGQSKNL